MKITTGKKHSTRKSRVLATITMGNATRHMRNDYVVKCFGDGRRTDPAIYAAWAEAGQQTLFKSKPW